MPRKKEPQMPPTKKPATQKVHPGGDVPSGPSGRIKATISLSQRNWEELRILSIREHTTASEILDRLIEEYLAKRR